MSGHASQRVLVGMSGGVDSSVAAALLLEQGYEVIGLTLKLWPQACAERAEDSCCGPQAVSDALKVCHHLGMDHYVGDETETLQREVVGYFASEYRAGRTPNPCIVCNARLKFNALMKRARQLGAGYVATGHYARVEAGEGGRTWLRRGEDPAKDQSYFLFALSQEQLAASLLPLGRMTKAQTREVARRAGLPTAEKGQSMEICFVPDKDYGRFLIENGLVTPHAGDIVDAAGRVLGRHEGIEFFTIGQRRGLRVAAAHPLYVVDLDPAGNRVIVGGRDRMERAEFEVEQCNWVAWERPTEAFEAVAQIRYNHRGTPATVTMRPDGTAHVRLQEPQFAVTPGQAAVFYREDLVLGGGWIRRSGAG